jgi:phenylacetate-CoA ligase
MNRAWDGLRRKAIYRPWVEHIRPGCVRHWRELRRLESASRDALAARQLQRLRELLIWAGAHSPFYRDRFRESGFSPVALRGLEDLAGLPALTKAELRIEGDRLLPGPRQPDWMDNASGGSTGEPVRLLQDANYWSESQAAQWLMEGWWGVRPGEATACVWGADRDLALRSPRERLADWIVQARYLNAFTVTEAEMHAFAAVLTRWQPRFLIGYASALDLLARFVREHGYSAIRPRAVKSTAEVLRPAERERIAAAFAAPVYDFYGSRESNCLAAECPEHRGLHVNNWSRLLEVVDGQGRPVGPGTPGRVLVTDLSNRATPLIRYENGDVGEWSAQACPCGRPFPLLARIVGRKSDFIHTPSGKLVHGEFFTHLFYDQPQVQSFQVVQSSLQRLQVDVVLADDRLPELVAALEPRMAAAVGGDVRIEFRRVAAIARSASGKHRFTRSELDLPWTGPTQS